MHARMAPRTVGIFLVGASLILSLALALGSHFLFGMIAAVLSSDRQISPDGQHQLTVALGFLGALLAAAGVICWQIKDAAGWAAIKRTFLTEASVSDLPAYASPRLILIATTILGLFLIIHINLYSPTSELFSILYLEDGVFESLSVLITLIGTICLVRAIWLMRQEPYRRSVPIWVLALLGAMALAFFLYAGEEISWGQRLLGWSTPEWIATGNVQEETNVHNYFNSYFPHVYQMFVLFPLPVLLSAWLAHSRRLSRALALILPHPSLIGLSLLIAGVAAVRPQEQELIEEMIAVFILGFCVRVLGYARAKWIEGAKQRAG